VNTVIIGEGGHAHDIVAILDALCVRHIACVGDITPNRVDATLLAYSARRYLLGVNDPNIRHALDTILRPAANAIHPTAAVDEDTDYTEGLVVGAHTTIGPRSSLGRHTHINANCFLTRAHLGNYVTVSPGAIICGDVTIGDQVTIGAGAVVSNLCFIGDRSVIGAGAVLPPNTHIPEDQTWVGVPARSVG
jgi:UDP-3-O-[3-hydroxymyristoyl] glucosamine N-acyltransferase